MTSVVAALDSYTPKNYGENGHLQHGWSNNDKEIITQLYFQLTRCSPDKMKELATQFKELFNTVKNSNRIFNNLHNDLEYLLYRLVIQTRDIISGKGEYNLSWHLINVLDLNGSSVIARKMIYYLVHELPESIKLYDSNVSLHPYGSWKDIKYLCNYHVPEEKRNKYYVNSGNDIIINKCIFLINEQLRIDQTAKVKTLLAKWIPREKSDKFG